jgi:phenylalanyl-tRNA synthetase alpha chain
MRDRIKAVEEEALKEIASARGASDVLEAIRIKYLGRKGAVAELFKKMAEVPPDEKAATGALINSLKDSVTKAIDASLASLASLAQGAGPGEDTADAIDITLPGVPAGGGSIHPVTKTINEICSLFISLGFRVVEGPEIETERYNFEALNIPLEHPSRDAFDTFYISWEKGVLLRSHTSPVQARFMEKNSPPFAIVVPGRVFRPDATDASHSFMFHQVEGLVVGPDIRFCDLKGTLEVFAKQIFGASARMRFRPSFFPFTEPSAEVDIECLSCGQNNPACRVCGGTGWKEILGSGMVDPQVFKNVNIDPEKYTGWAFGMGIDRTAMFAFGIPDIRFFFENDLRFNRQFRLK